MNQTLDEDVLLHSFGFLDFRWCCKIQGVCRYWKIIIHKILGIKELEEKINVCKDLLADFEWSYKNINRVALYFSEKNMRKNNELVTKVLHSINNRKTVMVVFLRNQHLNTIYYLLRTVGVLPHDICIYETEETCLNDISKPIVLCTHKTKNIVLKTNVKDIFLFAPYISILGYKYEKKRWFPISKPKQLKNIIQSK